VRDLTWDPDELKRRLDLRDVVAEAWGPGRRSGRAVMYRARWRDGDRTPSFAVYANGFKDFGGSGDAGDLFGWLQREYGLNFPEALTWAHERVYGAGAALSPRHRRPAPAPGEPPSPAWQRAALEALGHAQAYLWSDTADAARARAYLRAERGLTDETIRAYGLGYNPGWTRTRAAYWSETYGRQRRARLAPGIVIPWFRSGVLVALRVRCRVGGLAACLGVPPDLFRGAPISKYRSFLGSRLSGALFGGDALRPDRPALLAEGEFDAMLAAQALAGRMTVVTPGSATNRVTRRMRDALLTAPHVYSAFDRDAAGEEAERRLARALRDRFQPLALPIGKDITEYLLLYGGDLARWVSEATAPASLETPALL
jgi:DNA primase